VFKNPPFIDTENLTRRLTPKKFTLNRMLRKKPENSEKRELDEIIPIIKLNHKRVVAPVKIYFEKDKIYKEEKDVNKE